MNIQTEKIELIKRLVEVDDSEIINKLKAILIPKIQDETERIMANPELGKKIQEARQEITEGKGIKIDVNNLWK
jgi:hypothetical protein